jgi:hypothetical protein
MDEFEPLKGCADHLRRVFSLHRSVQLRGFELAVDVNGCRPEGFSEKVLFALLVFENLIFGEILLFNFLFEVIKIIGLATEVVKDLLRINWHGQAVCFLEFASG